MLATLVGLSVAVFVMRPEAEPLAPNVYGKAISPGTDARVRIDVQLVGGSNFFESVRTTARLVDMDRNLEKQLAALGQCGMQIQLAQNWSSGESNDTLSPIAVGAAHMDPGCVDNTFAELAEQVPASINTAYYWYPFDRLTYRVRAETRILYKDLRDWQWRLATPELHFTAPGWRVTQRELPGSREQTVIPNPGGGRIIRRTPGAGIVEAKLSRPFAVRLSVVLFLFVLLVAVISITHVETLGDSLQVAIAVSVLLWTSREALVPGVPRLFLAVDAVFLGLALLVLGNVLALGWRHGGKPCTPRHGQNAATPADGDLHSVLVILDGSPVFHREDCPRLREIPADRQQRVVRIPQGRRPCRVCAPPVP
ncbi:MAG TPA: hypothetical protein VLV54_09200 [Thermoanaerobaculia bacterium]|nr:hypothetical protein [Thermoanaerobaculia bacterium]